MRRRVHYVLSTHWDREWYQTFQDFRYRLVQLLDRVLEGWRSGTLHGPFQTDGQAILIEDYLEIRPERRAEIEQRACEGRLVIGPWYVMPDEFLVSGESLVRNLRLGRETARMFGGVPSHAGFLCDMFGHNSQMPQIFSGFGIDGAFVWRGVNQYQPRHFTWRSPDGSQLPAYRFPWNGYCTYAVAVRAANQALFRPTAEQIAERLESHLQTEAQQTIVDPILAFDGGDHMEWDQPAYAVLAQRFGDPADGFDIVHSSLDAYLEELKPESGKIIPLIEGELREPGLEGGSVDQQWLIPGVTSSRVWIKQANAACESLLCQWAEPFSALAQRAGTDADPAGFLNAAWKWLISNHPHDSMGGCSIDAVHEDMRFRFAQAEGIANHLAQASTQTLAASVDAPLAEGDLRVAIFNPLPCPYQGVADLVLDTPTDWPASHNMTAVEMLPSFHIYDAQGSELPYQRLGQTPSRMRTRMYDVSFPRSYQVNEVRVALPVEIPPLGYTTLTVRPERFGGPTRHAQVSRLAASERSIENEYLAVQVEANGALTLTDKRNGQIYTRLLTFEDLADIGDGWNHGPATNDQAFTSTASRAAVAVAHAGPQLAALRVRTTFDLPVDFDFSLMKRSEQVEPLVIDSILTLRLGRPVLEVETIVNNTASDHRLRVLFPSGTREAQTYFADTPFDVVERSIALRADNYRYREPEVETKPQQTWFAVQAGERGLAVVSSGLLESAVLDLPERPLALTLLRSTRTTVNTDGEPLGQVQGLLKFCYWIAPLAGAVDPVYLCELGQRLAGGLRVVQLLTQDVQQHRAAVALPPAAGFVRLEGQVVLTSLRQVGDSLEMRCFNPTAVRQRARLDLRGWPDNLPAPASATPVNFESQALGAAEPLEEGQIAFALGPKQIVTLRLA